MQRTTFAGRLDADGLEASVEGRRVDDVGVEVAVVLPVDEERHHHRDHQAHDHRDDDTHVQSHVVRTGGHCRWEKKGGRMDGETEDREKNSLLRPSKFTSITAAFDLNMQEL